MENFAVLLIPVLVGALLLRLIALPLRLLAKLGLHALCGFLCLWLLNSVSGFTGVYFPVNMVTVLLAGILGVPGIALMALLQLFGQ